MTESETTESRYGDERLFFYKDSKWYTNLKECLFIRVITNYDKTLSAIDPDGGPYIAIGDKLSRFNKALPDITISKIEHVKDNIYQLT